MHTKPSTSFSIKSSLNITSTDQKPNTFHAWSLKVSRTLNSPKLNLLWSTQQESELEETWPTTHLVLESPRLKETKSWRRLLMLARLSKEILQEHSTHLMVWTKLLKTNWSPIISSSKREIDSWRLAISTETGHPVEVSSIMMPRLSSSGSMRRINSESFLCKMDPVFSKFSIDSAELLLISKQLTSNSLMMIISVTSHLAQQILELPWELPSISNSQN